EHLVYTERVGGSSPSTPTVMHGRDLPFSTVLFLWGFCSVVLADSAAHLASEASMAAHLASDFPAVPMS
ncbi:MAG: hypothetical protein OSA89_16815, partial [Mariniblastus sp.]|nr:hypothetical protein [Mariniblastus sp.]